MRNRLFDKNVLTINFDKFMQAVKSGNSEQIDAFLEAKQNGYELDLNKEEFGKTALEILLEKHDITNAAKLINAGAETEVSYKVWVDDDGPYPYGGFETRKRSAFANCHLTKDDLVKLTQGSAKPESESQEKQLVSSMAASLNKLDSLSSNSDSSNKVWVDDDGPYPYGHFETRSEEPKSTEQVWVDDDGPYPYGHYETRCRR